MENIFEGIIKKKNDGDLIIKLNEDKTQKLFNLNDELRFLYEDEISFQLKENTKVLFSVNKKIYSDKTELFAKIHKVVDNGWDEIYKNYLKNTSSYSLSDYQSYLKSNFLAPEFKRDLI